MMSKAWPIKTAAFAAPHSYVSTTAAYQTRRSSAAEVLVDTIRHYQRWRAMRKTIVALSGLESHMLKDIGIDRSEIPSVARRVADQSW